jgi:hypothetical protein
MQGIDKFRQGNYLVIIGRQVIELFAKLVDTNVGGREFTYPEVVIYEDCCINNRIFGHGEREWLAQQKYWEKQEGELPEQQVW